MSGATGGIRASCAGGLSAEPAGRATSALTLAEAVLEPPRQVLQVASAPSPRRLAANRLLRPVNCDEWPYDMSAGER